MSTTPLAEAVDVRRWLEKDADTPFDARVARDHEIGRGLKATDDLVRIRGWWSQINSDPAEELGTRLVSLVRFATVLLFAAGLLVGVSIGSVAFAYDGQHPVNLLALLGVLVGVPLLLLLLTLVFLLPGRIPGLGAMREAISVINPGRWVGAWLDRFTGLSLYGGFSGVQSSFARWQLIVFSQWLAVGYFAGVLLAGWLLVALTDLAFGWSSTLELEPQTVYRLFSALALPWQGWLPAAAPDLALVEASRFFRLETDPVSAIRAVQLGQWWPFVLMTVLVWGMAPRVLLLLVGRWRLQAAVGSMLSRDPEVVALLDRLARPRVDFKSAEEDQALADAGTLPAQAQLIFNEGTAIVFWNDALSDDAARRWLDAEATLTEERTVRLGVRMSAEEMHGQLAKLSPALQRVIVFTKGWEPPLLEFADFLGLLRETVGEGVTLTVVPVNTKREGVDPDDREVWAGFLARHADRRLYVLQATNAEAGA